MKEIPLGPQGVLWSNGQSAKVDKEDKAEYRRQSTVIFTNQATISIISGI
jgi:hypothetical protein